MHERDEKQENFFRVLRTFRAFRGLIFPYHENTKNREEHENFNLVSCSSYLSCFRAFYFKNPCIILFTASS